MKKSNGLATFLIFCSLPIIPRVAFADQINFNNYIGPSLFANAGPMKVLNIPTPSGTYATFSGGVILTNATNSPADETSAYSTTSGFPGVPLPYQYYNPLTITFSNPVHDFSMTVLNGQPFNATYRVTDNAGYTTQFTLPSNLQGGQQSVGFPTSSKANIVKIQAVSSSPQWNFAIDNVDFNYTPSGPPPGPSSHSQALINSGKLKLDIAAAGLTAIGVICAASVVCGAGVALTAGIAGLVVGAVSLAADYVDPLDLNFEKIAQPAPPSPPALPAGLPSKLLSPFSNLLQSSTKAIGYFNAAQTSYNRAEGAYYSQSPYYEKLQLKAANSYLRAGDLSAMSIGRNLAAIGSLLPNYGLASSSISASQIQAFESGLAANGFSSQQTATLQSLGLDNQEISQILNDLTSQNPALLSGNYPEQLVNFGNEIVSAEKVAVPEPSSLWLMLAGLVMLFACRMACLGERIRLRRQLAFR